MAHRLVDVVLELETPQKGETVLTSVSHILIFYDLLFIVKYFFFTLLERGSRNEWDFFMGVLP